MLIFGGRHRQHVLDEHARHYNGQRPHRSSELRPPPPTTSSLTCLSRGPDAEPCWGGLINEYQPAA
jgi:putative transposase